jgi:hypothetical protein
MQQALPKRRYLSIKLLGAIFQKTIFKKITDYDYFGSDIV